MTLQTQKHLEFQPTPSCRGRPPAIIAALELIPFQPTPSCRGRRKSCEKVTQNANFNPRPRAEGGSPQSSAGIVHQISTHALVQRAASDWSLYVLLPYFNPRPRAEGGPERLRPSPSRRMPYFNPRPRAEGGVM